MEPVMNGISYQRVTDSILGKEIKSLSNKTHNNNIHIEISSVYPDFVKDYRKLAKLIPDGTVVQYTAERITKRFCNEKQSYINAFDMVGVICGNTLTGKVYPLFVKPAYRGLDIEHNLMGIMKCSMPIRDERLWFYYKRKGMI